MALGEHEALDYTVNNLTVAYGTAGQIDHPDGETIRRHLSAAYRVARRLARLDDRDPAAYFAAIESRAPAQDAHARRKRAYYRRLHAGASS